MRKAILALFMTLAFAVAGPAAAEGKKLPPNVGSGRAAWFDISTSSLPRSKDFYGKLFDWRFNPIPGTDQAVEIVSRGRPIGTLRAAEGAISAFNGVVYIQVADIVASCEKAKALGATVAAGFPFNLNDGTGAIALAVDPIGHPIGMYSRKPIPPAAPAASR
jgi:predicted enzyme related to lactoylglutathione lyase